MADVQTGFGSFVAFYLADQGWSEKNVGCVLTAGGLSGVVGQIPGGALVDAMRRKKLLIAVGTLMIAVSAVLLALSSDFPAVFAAEVLHGATGAIIGPAIAAVSLGLRRSRARAQGRSEGVTQPQQNCVFSSLTRVQLDSIMQCFWTRGHEPRHGDNLSARSLVL